MVPDSYGKTAPRAGEENVSGPEEHLEGTCGTVYQRTRDLPPEKTAFQGLASGSLDLLVTLRLQRLTDRTARERSPQPRRCVHVDQKLD
ncbi:hypothetical protein GWK47_028723 [Chionoecetes opilio]|uniref:Uncharacterized protein n=1 Tax=Chionoecetes opilio TaxID=41210 RepID=A0A8J4Z4R6_CHIOP|nr:hypothetical protein GWK47_028723 [Chionoecetes opilio]